MSQVKFIKTTKSSLKDMPITDGQIIAVSDSADLLYDVNGVRYDASQNIQWQELDEIVYTYLFKESEGMKTSYKVNQGVGQINVENSGIFATILNNEGDSDPQLLIPLDFTDISVVKADVAFTNPSSDTSPFHAIILAMGPTDSGELPQTHMPVPNVQDRSNNKPYTTDRRTISLDVSSITGSKYLMLDFFGWAGYSDMYVYNIYYA